MKSRQNYMYAFDYRIVYYSRFCAINLQMYNSLKVQCSTEPNHIYK